VKKDIHPDYHEITVQMTDGGTYTTRSMLVTPSNWTLTRKLTLPGLAYTAFWTVADSWRSLTKNSRD